MHRRRVRYRLPMTDGRLPRAAGTDERRDRTIAAAMRHFADHGYRGAHVEDIAHEVGVAKGTVFLDFGSKEGLFLAAYQRAVQMLPAWLDAPDHVVREGFWATLDWWLQSTEEFVDSDPVPNRLAMIGRYDTGLGLRRPIDRFMRSEDPYGTLDFVEFGVRTGEIRDDVDPEMIASMIDWLAQRFQDALVSEDLDPGLIHRRPERRTMRIKEFVEILRGGIADDGTQP
jgi:AcrR family transcriptional regulator